MNINEKIAAELGIRVSQVDAAVALIDEGNTIPFIARYRKEAHGSLDDQVLRALSERLTYLRNLEEQREKVRAAIEAQGKLTDEIAESLDAAQTMTEIDDIYRPFRPKRRTLASIAKEKGLEPLALAIYAQEKNSPAPIELAKDYVNEELKVNTPEEALKGALDIVAEMISDDADLRKLLRMHCMEKGVLSSKGDAEDLGVYETYADYSEPCAKIAGHRVLAVNRGEREEILKVKINLERSSAVDIVYKAHVKEGSPCTDAVISAADDAYDRLIFPSIEREIRNALTDTACENAIKVFSVNLRQILMQAPVKGKTTLGLDPGYRTGCKVAVVDATGKVLDTGVIFPVEQFGKVEAAKAKIKDLIKKHKVEVISIGNGTASHETEMFAADVIREIGGGVAYMVVSEAGASVYSASKLAAEEFPDYDVSLRSAVSIARRLQDPLAELVKIDPKAIGVGQYQHDMPQNQLSDALDGVVEDCVNNVGVDLNTASVQLLSRVSGVHSGIAKNIVTYRQENGEFKSRKELLKVPKLGAKAFEQCAGFLRVPESSNIFDNTAVHPESYDAAKALIARCGYSDAELALGKISDLDERVKAIGKGALAKELGIGLPTLEDIIAELKRPGRDPRDELPAPLLRTDIMSLEDLKIGMELKGTVRNVIDFGAFVDIGVHEDGLVHISQISNRYIKHPSEVLKVGDIVTVWVLTVDVKKKRIGLTMKKPKDQAQ
ncbi:MAG: RNA-binding transcriptional accessory protein [Clostridia bacterium]|nr:RNA-binding transcriptional accessory protein [Clostridia bacterium]